MCYNNKKNEQQRRMSGNEQQQQWRRHFVAVAVSPIDANNTHRSQQHASSMVASSGYMRCRWIDV